jgi:carboxymethylenebutenolidase
MTYQPRGATVGLISRFDGIVVDAYHVEPTDARRGGLVLIQEIFGVTDHIRELADGFAADGYEVLAPSFYDRLEPGFEADYGAEAVQKGVAYSQATPWDQVAGDIQTAIDALAERGKVFATGFCWGGAATWLAACRCDGLAAASAFYGRRISELVDEVPQCPIILHFGKTDASIPMEKVAEIEARHPDVPVWLYDAGHGFVSDRRADYSQDAARLARLRTLQLFSRNTGGKGEA